MPFLFHNILSHIIEWIEDLFHVGCLFHAEGELVMVIVTHMTNLKLVVIMTNLELVMDVTNL